MKKLAITAAVTSLMMVASTAAAATFTYDYMLRYGMRGAEVVELQECLNSLGYNVGYADGVFGRMTLAGVKAFQADKALAPDGVVGPMTGAKLELACGGDDSSTGTGSDDDASDDDADSSNNGCQEGWKVNPYTGESCDMDATFDGSGDEASFTGSDMDQAPDASLHEGDEEVVLGTFAFRNEDSAVKIEKFDAILSTTTAASTSDEDDAWKVFDKLYLYVDGDLVASKEVDDRSMWRDRTISDATIAKDEDNRVRFSGLNKVLAKDEDHEIVLKADIASSVDMDADGAQWAWIVDETAIRFLDEAGLTQYLTEEDTNDEQIATFTIVQAGSQDELEVSSSSADPESTTFEVKDTEVSDEFLAFAFRVKADEDGNDLEISEIQLKAVTGTANFDKVVDEVTLKIDGKEEDYDIGSSSNLNTTTATLVFDFDGKEITIPAGEEETAKVYVRFKSKNGGANYADGETIQFKVEGADVDAWDVVGEDDLTAAQLTGSATGEVHSLYENGVIVTKESESVTTQQDQNGDNTKVTYTMTVKMKAFGDAVYFKTEAEEGNPLLGPTDSVLGYVFEDGNGSPITVGNTTATHVVTTTADDEGAGVYRIDAGDEATITLKVVLDAVTGGMPGFYRLQLKQARVSTDAGLTNDIIIDLLPEQDFESDSALLDN